MAEVSNSPVEALIGLINSKLLDVNTCLPGVIVSYAGGLAKVLPTGKKRFEDGDTLDYPVIPNARVCWPAFAGGSAGVKGPVKAGDKCLLVFSQQAVDGSDDRRMFDLQDVYAVMCDLGASGQGDSGNNEDMTMFFGPAYLRLTADGKFVVNAPGGTEVNTPTTLLNTQSTTNTGTLTTQGLFTYQAGMVGSGGGSGTTITGTVNVDGNIIQDGDLTQTGGALSSNGVVLETHVHSGVTPGGSNTGEPV